MIDFKNATFAKLKMVDFSEFANMITPLLIQGEEVIGTYKGIRDGVVFTFLNNTATRTESTSMLVSMMQVIANPVVPIVGGS